MGSSVTAVDRLIRLLHRTPRSPVADWSSMRRAQGRPLCPALHFRQITPKMEQTIRKQLGLQGKW